MTVPPSEFLISFSSASSASSQSTRRWVPIGRFSGHSGARLTVPHSTSPAPSAVSRSSSAVRVGLAAAFSARSAIPIGALTRSLTPLPTISASLGSGPGDHSRSGWGTSAGSRSRSKSTVMMSTPETPSTSAWWVLLMSAKRPSSRPSISQISHSGLVRSRRWEKMRPARLRRFSIEPGLGSAVCLTW